jgi:hypothetical protein
MKQNFLLLESGNIFKTPDGKSETSRIVKSDIFTTVSWLENITGLSLKDNMLGSGGKKESSGDLDIGVDESKTSKDELVNILSNWCVKNNYDPKQFIKKSGISVHFKTPINGKEENGYVQTDFMFGDLNWLKFAMFSAGDASKYKGQLRRIVMQSIAKAKGYTIGGNALIDRETKKEITRDPQQIATLLLGQNSSPSDFDSVETMLNKIKTDPNYKNLIKDASEYFQKQGLTLESINVYSNKWFSDMKEFLK